jgi:opacity protein-like surface antigen
MRRSHVRFAAVVPAVAFAVLVAPGSAQAAHYTDEPLFRSAGHFVLDATSGGGLGSLGLDGASSNAANAGLTPFLFYGHDSADLPPPQNQVQGVTTTGNQSTSVFVFAPAFDYFVIDGISVGGEVSAGSWDNTQSSTTTVAGVSNTTTIDVSGSFWGIAPRVGFDFAFNEQLSIWVRAGFGYSHGSSSTQGQSGSTSSSRFGLGLDAMLLWHVAPRFFIGVGPGVSHDMSASTSVDDGKGTTTTTDDAKVTRWRPLTFTVGGVM